MSCPPPTRPGPPRQAPPQVDGAFDTPETRSGFRTSVASAPHKAAGRFRIAARASPEISLTVVPGALLIAAALSKRPLVPSTLEDPKRTAGQRALPAMPASDMARDRTAEPVLETAAWACLSDTRRGSESEEHGRDEDDLLHGRTPMFFLERNTEASGSPEFQANRATRQRRAARFSEREQTGQRVPPSLSYGAHGVWWSAQATRNCSRDPRQ